ncbi:unnamed protein product [Cylicocyclus nassatus]|uniref:Uncharacterized protein n=1 Tax=Cylicocyclus nassatus TaxID=53992 RepID=A0AA36GFC3_CYLNA|nr:unnamed protein product [Cylicocyclus nassatus]CAJ0592390.1 unnamed protein product [Cylicocyclus nassatus]CAJ0592391.1 unnamed protein product [Cylicocyclus nassatus]
MDDTKKIDMDSCPPMYVNVLEYANKNNGDFGDRLADRMGVSNITIKNNMADENTNIPKTPGLGASAISGAIGGVTALAQTALQNKYNEQARKQQREDEQAIHDRNRREFLADRQHDEVYNSPSMQRFRRILAGLNPNDATYDPVATDSAGNSPTEEIANLSNLGAKAPDSLAGALSVGQTMADIEQKKSQARANNAEATNTEQKVSVFGQEFELSKAESLARTSQLYASASELYNMIPNIQADTEYKKHMSRNMKVTADVSEVLESCRIRTELLQEKYQGLMNDEVSARIDVLRKQFEQMDDYLSLEKFNAQTARIDANAHDRSSYYNSLLTDAEYSYFMDSYNSRLDMLSNELTQSNITTENLSKITGLSIDKLQAEIDGLVKDLDVKDADINQKEAIAKAMIMNAYTNTICQPISTLSGAVRDAAYAYGQFSTGGLAGGLTPQSPVNDFQPTGTYMDAMAPDFPYQHYSWQRSPTVVNSSGQVNPRAYTRGARKPPVPSDEYGNWHR